MPYLSNIFFPVCNVPDCSDGVSALLPYFSNHNIDLTNHNIKLLVVVMHGANTIVDEPCAAETALREIGDAARLFQGAATSTLIVAPQLEKKAQLEKHYGLAPIPSQIMWGGNDRFRGGRSRNESGKISFFTAIDRLLANKP